MSRLKKPKDSVKDVFIKCISNVQEPQKSALEACIADIVSYSNDYETSVKSKKLEKLLPVNSIRGISQKELEKVYTQKMVKKGQPGQIFYDTYMILPPNGVCPYCGQRMVSTLDHYLPKSRYIPLIVTPTNLIPCCRDCNSDKLDVPPNTMSEVLFNPYYEDLNDTIWLKANLEETLDGDTPIMTFSIKVTEGETELFDRLKNHFSVFKLNSLYSKHAAQELVGVNRRYIRIMKNCGKYAVLLDIQEQLDDNSDNPNSWKVAMYRELLENPWFVDAWLNK